MSSLFEGRKSFRQTFIDAEERRVQRELDTVRRRYDSRIRKEVYRKTGEKTPPVRYLELKSKAGNELLNDRRKATLKPTSPVFHDDLIDRVILAKETIVRHETRYNPLDKELTPPGVIGAPSSGRKGVSLTEMRRPRITPLGVLPPRDSNLLERLNVFMDGAALDTRGVEEDVWEPIGDPFREFSPSPYSHGYYSPKPAIASQTGTLAPIAFTQRPAPPSMPPTYLRSHGGKRIRDKPKSVFHSEDYRYYTSPIPGGVEAPVTSPAEVTPEGREAETMPVRKERSVDEIISSLKEMESTGYQLSDADKRIQEVMDQVMSRTESMLGVKLDGGPYDNVADRKSSISRISTAMDDRLDEVADDDHPRTPSVKDDELVVGDVSSQDVLNEVIESEQYKDADQYGGDLLDYDRRIADSLEGEDLLQAWKDFTAPETVTNEDLINIEGIHEPLYEKVMRRSADDQQAPTQAAHLSSWDAPPHRTGGSRHTSIHHFCINPPTIQLPFHLQSISAALHAPSQYMGTKDSYTTPTPTPSFQATRSRVLSTPTSARRIKSAAKRIVEDAQLEDMEQRARVVESEMEAPRVHGDSSVLYNPEARIFWALAAPKMDLPPGYIGSVLFPEFSGAALGSDPMVVADGLTSRVDTSAESEPCRVDDEEPGSTPGDRETSVDRTTPTESVSREHVALRRHASDEHLQRSASLHRSTTSATTISSSHKEITPDDNQSVNDDDGDSSNVTEDVRKKPLSDEEFYAACKEFALRRVKSARDVRELAVDRDNEVIVDMTYTEYMEELTYQKGIIEHIVAKKREDEQLMAELERSPTVGYAETEVSEGISSHHGSARKSAIQVASNDGSVAMVIGATAAELARETSMAEVAGRKKKRLPSTTRTRRAQQWLQTLPRQLERCLSAPSVFVEQGKSKKSVVLAAEAKVAFARRGSVDNLGHFGGWLADRGTEANRVPDVREYVRDVWEEWFDEVIPPLTPTPITPPTDPSAAEQPKKRESTTLNVQEIETALVVTEKNVVIVDRLAREVERLSFLIANGVDLAFSYCRRGGLLRKLGNIKQAWTDLNISIDLEPKILSAYWHRHLIQLLQGNHFGALEDIKFILKHNNNHAEAYRSAADLYNLQGNPTMSIISFSKRIKLCPDDSNAFYNRGLVYASQKEFLLAQEDFASASRLDPSLTDARFRHGMYYFDKGNWLSASVDFTAVVTEKPEDATAYVYRGRCYAKLSRWVDAVADFSAALHLDPNNPRPYYHRGCVLRSAHPYRALRDFSVSLMLDDSHDNVMAYLHRAIIYTDIEMFIPARIDYEIVVGLDKRIACAHANLGTLDLRVNRDPRAALRRYTDALRADPTYVRALVCRAEVYSQIGDHSNALLDYTRAIHLDPGKQHLYIRRGNVLLAMGNLHKASFCIKQASGVQTVTSISLPLQAMLYSFMGDHESAINALLSATRVKADVATFLALGDTQVKARRYKDASISFQRAVQILTPLDPRREKMPPESGDVFYKLGKCNLELGNYKAACAAFTSCLQVRPRHSKALYRRGLAKVRLGHMKEAIHDFNKSLLINPKLCDAYLARACFYGMHGRYTKGIANCNEALLIQPRSVRGLIYRGALKYYIRSYEYAIEDLTMAVTKLDPSAWLGYFNRAVCYRALGRYQRALRDYSIALMQPHCDKRRVLVNRGLLYFDVGDYRNSMADFQEGYDGDSTGPEINHTFGLCLHKQRRLTEAVAAFTTALEADPLFLDALIGRGNVYMDYRSSIGHDLAIADYEAALSRNPRYLPARVNLAYCYQVMGRFQRAWDEFSRAISDDPTYQPGLEGRAVVNLQMGAPLAAVLDLNAAIEVRATAELLTNRGVVHQFTGDRINAIRDYQKALQLNNKYSLAWFNAANIYFHNRQFKQALEYYDMSVFHDKTDENGWLNRAITKVMLKDTSGAFEDFDEAIKRCPYYSHAFFNRGNLHAATGNLEHAESDYTAAIDLQGNDPVFYKRRADVKGKLGDRDGAMDDYKKAIDLHELLEKLKIRKKS